MTQGTQKTPETPGKGADYAPDADSHPEETRLADFQETLARVAIRPLTVRVDIEHNDPAEQAKDEFFRTDFQGGATFYALPEISLELQEDLKGFEPIESSKKASRHGVFFGTLLFNEGLELPVAVKPHKVVDKNDPLSRREAETSCLTIIL